MKISEELRRWCDNADVDGDACGELRALANRIDAEMIELPKDRDVVPIHVGETVYGDDGEAWHVRGVVLCSASVTEIRFSVKAIGDDGSNHGLKPEWLTHNRPDSWERIADEMDEMVDSADQADDGCERLADLADRIRKMTKKEHE